MTYDVIKDVEDLFNTAQEEIDNRGEKLKKKEIIEDWNIGIKLNQIEKSKKKLDKLKNLKLSTAFGEQYIKSMEVAQEVRVNSFAQRLPFILPVLSQMVNLAAQELIFIGAKSGRGKSTTIANIIATYITQKKANPELKPILVISNEEKAESVLNRVICLFLNWNINNFKNFTPDQYAKLNSYRKEFIERKFIVVIDPEFHLLPGATFTIEGVKAIMESALEEEFGLILMDYYQKFAKSEENPGANKVAVLTELSEYLDSYVKRSSAPVVIMGQLKTEGKDRVEFEDRIKESKSILQNCTQALEMITDKEKLKTTIIKRKDRWDQRENMAVELGFDKGRYVEYTKDFSAMVAHNMIRKAELEEAAESLSEVNYEEQH